MDIRSAARYVALYAGLLVLAAGRQMVSDFARTVVPMLAGATLAVLIGATVGCPRCAWAARFVRTLSTLIVTGTSDRGGRRKRKRDVPVRGAVLRWGRPRFSRRPRV